MLALAMRALVVLMVAACGAAAPAVQPAASREGDAWPRVHQLLDRFDQARFGGDAAARAELLAALNVGGAGDAKARTDAVIDALLVEVDRVLANDRLHAGAGAARLLLEHDRQPAHDRRELLARTVALKGVARGRGPVAANAILRLGAICERALGDTPAAPPRERPLVLATCLYPLYDADPEPYFDPDPARRPPPPAWEELEARLDELYAPLRGSASRVAPAATVLAEKRRPMLREAAARGLLPQPLDPRALGVPAVADPALALPYDWEPFIVVRRPTAAELAGFEEKLGGMLEVDGRRRVALALAADEPASGFVAVAGLARRLGAEQVELVVGWQQGLKPPPGDYWYGRARDGQVARAGVLPLELDASRLGARAALGLRLRVGPRAWQIVSPSGSLPEIALGPDAAPARASLRAQLARVLDAFPDEGALVVSVLPEVTAAGLAAAVHAAERTADGGPLVGALAIDLGATAPAPARGTLEERVARRAAARVTVVPDALAARAPALRRCWQEAVDRGPGRPATLALETEGRTVKVVSRKLEDAALERCLVDRIQAAMLDAGIGSARIELSR